jgi:hypothetical protein
VSSPRLLSLSSYFWPLGMVAGALSAVPVLGQVPNRSSVSYKRFSETGQGKRRKGEPGL